MQREYNHTIDCLKGLLIICVIIGHLIPGGLNSNFLRYSLYTFHMPLFLFISGYLFDLERIKLTSRKELLKKYWKRMLLEWLMAWVVFTTIILYSDLSVRNIFYHIVYPFYHLWYVPALLAMILVLVETYRLFEDKYATYVFLFFITAIVAFLCYYKRMLNPAHVSLFSFFLLGTLSRSMKTSLIKHFKMTGGGILIVYLAVLIFIWKVEDTPFDVFARYVQVPLLGLFCSFVLLPFIIENKEKSRFLEFIGRNSLHFYLWHMLPIVLINYDEFV